MANPLPNSLPFSRIGLPAPPHPRVLLAAAASVGRDRVQAMLEGRGCRIEPASDGSALLDALRLPEAAPFLLVDGDLPGLNGLALLDMLQQQSDRGRTWTILLTEPAAGASPLSRDPGFDDFLASRWDEFELFVCLHAASRIQTRSAEMAEAVDAARFRASHDSLTGLWNREALLGLLFQETDRAQRLGSPLAFLLLDLDNFSRINREHGLDGGDRVLRQLASRFRRHLRSYDLAGRCGGDEFLIAMPGGTADDARSMAARLRECVADRPFDILKASLTVTASVGIALSEGRSPLVVLREAETALGGAKRAGRDCVRFFNPDSEPALDDRIDIRDEALQGTATRSAHV